MSNEADILRRVYTAVATAGAVAAVEPPKLSHISRDQRGEDEQVETLQTISSRIGKSIDVLRALNPHLDDYDSDEPLPPGTKLVVKSKKDKSQESTRRRASTAVETGESSSPVGRVAGRDPDALPSQRTAEPNLLRGTGSANQQASTPQTAAATAASTSTAITANASISDVTNSGRLTVRRLGAKFRLIEREVKELLPELLLYNLDDPIPQSVLRGKVVRGVALDALCSDGPLSGQSGSNPPHSLDAWSSARCDPVKLPLPVSPLPRHGGSTEGPVSPSVLRGTGQAGRGSLPDRSHGDSRSLGTSAPVVDVRNISPPHPQRSSYGSNANDGNAGRATTPRSLMERRDRRYQIRTQAFTDQRKTFDIYVTPGVDDDDDDDAGGNDGAEASGRTLRSIARRIARCSVDDLLDLNPELETIFTIDDSLPPNTVVCIPSTATAAAISSRSKQLRHRTSSQPSPSRTSSVVAATANDSGFLEVTPSRPHRAVFADVESTSAVNPTRSPGTVASVPRVVLHSVAPSVTLGRCVTEIAWSLGMPVDELRSLNPDLDMFASHEVLPAHVRVQVPLPSQNAITSPAAAVTEKHQSQVAQPRPRHVDTSNNLSLALHAETPSDVASQKKVLTSRDEELLAISRRWAEAQRQPPPQSGAPAAEPTVRKNRYERLTNRSPVRTASSVEQPQLMGAQGNLGALQSGLRTASSSVATIPPGLTNAGGTQPRLRKFVVTAEGVSVGMIAEKLRMSPDVILQLNRSELIDGPEGRYGIHQQLPLGLLLYLPIRSN